MKRTKSIFLICLLAFNIVGCGRKDILDIAGEYKFDSVKYLSMLSSASKDYIEEKAIGDTYSISNDGIIITSVYNPYEYSDIRFEKVKLENDYIEVFGDFERISLDGYHEKYQYNIYDKENNLLNIRFYYIDKELWLSHFNNLMKSNVTFDILKLMKLQ